MVELSNSTKNIIANISICILVLILTGLFISFAIFSKHNIQLANECYRILDAKTADISPRLDWYGREFRYQYRKENTMAIAIVTCAGWDGKFDTSDDRQHVAVNYNKSYIVGRYIGPRLKEFSRGIVDGLKE